MKKRTQIVVNVEQDKKLICTRWLQTMNSHDYRAALMYFFRSIRKHQAIYWLLDMNHLSSPTMADQKWTIHYMSHALKGTSIQKVALVLPNDLLLELVIEKIWEGIDHEVQEKIPTEYFRQSSQALQWLLPASDTEGLFRTEAVNGN